MAEVVLIEATETLTHVSIQGNLDDQGVEEINLRLTSQIVTRRQPVILDLTSTGFVTSLGIGLLVSIARAMRSLHLGMVILVGSSKTRHILELTHIGAMIPLVDTREQALRVLQEA